MPYQAIQDEECGCWLVQHDGRDVPGLICHQDRLLAEDLARLLTWAEEDRLRSQRLPKARKSP